MGQASVWVFMGVLVCCFIALGGDAPDSSAGDIILNTTFEGSIIFVSNCMSLQIINCRSIPSLGGDRL